MHIKHLRMMPRMTVRNCKYFRQICCCCLCEGRSARPTFASTPRVQITHRPATSTGGSRKLGDDRPPKQVLSLASPREPRTLGAKTEAEMLPPCVEHRTAAKRPSRSSFNGCPYWDRRCQNTALSLAGQVRRCCQAHHILQSLHNPTIVAVIRTPATTEWDGTTVTQAKGSCLPIRLSSPLAISHPKCDVDNPPQLQGWSGSQ